MTSPTDEPVEADCGHVLVEVAGDVQHHEIPDDGAPHAPTSECGCGPDRCIAGGHTVYVHVDQDAEPLPPEGEQHGGAGQALDG